MVLLAAFVRVAVFVSVRVGVRMVVVLPVMMAGPMLVLMLVFVLVGLAMVVVMLMLVGMRMVVFVRISANAHRVLSGQPAAAMSTHDATSCEGRLLLFAVRLCELFALLNFQ
jgi:hypothetical protein